MTDADPQTPAEVRTDGGAPAEKAGQRSHGSHSRWAMIACCVPMLVIAGVLVALGAGTGFLLVAVGCTLMMALMMAGMGDHDR